MAGMQSEGFFKRARRFIARKIFRRPDQQPPDSPPPIQSPISPPPIQSPIPLEHPLEHPSHPLEHSSHPLEHSGLEHPLHQDYHIDDYHIPSISYHIPSISPLEHPFFDDIIDDYHIDDYHIPSANIGLPPRLELPVLTTDDQEILTDDQEEYDKDSYQKHDTVYSSTQSNVIKENPCAAQSMNESTNKQFNYQSLSEDKFKGVHVAGRKLFKIQNNLPQVLNWEEYGLRITVPEGAISSSETTEVAITALVGGEFILPEDSELVSAVYTISVSKPLLKRVRLEIQHCVSIETHSHANYLSFVTSSSECCPFQFQSVDKGSFPVGGRYGSIHVPKLSQWGIVQTIKGWFKKLHHSSHQTTHHTTFDTLDECAPIPPSSSTLPQSVDASAAMPPSSQDLDLLPASWFYFTQPLYQNKSPGEKWLLMFLFGKDLNALIKYMNEKFTSAESDREFYFRFERSDGFLEIHIDTEKCSEGWSISPHQGSLTEVSRVSQSTIDAYGQMNPPRFPQCFFTITATPGINTNPELRHPVSFKGIISDNTVFNIVLSMYQLSPEEIFKKYKKVLSEKIPFCINTIVDEVYSSDLIDDDTRDRCRANTDTLFNALTIIIDQPGVLTKLIEVFKTIRALKPIAEEMEREFKFT